MYVRNPTRYPLRSEALQRQLLPGEIVDVDEAIADEACASGIFDRPSAEEVAQIIATSR